MRREREEKTIRLRTLLTGALVVGVLAVWLVWWQWDRAVDRLCAARGGDSGRGVSSLEEESPVTDRDEKAEGREAMLLAAEQRWESWLGRAPVWPGDFASPAECTAVEEDLARICERIDAEESGVTSGIPGGMCGLLQKVSEELAARPPVLASELRSYPSMLGNVFHLFRVVGKQRLDRLRRILSEQEEHAEPVAMALYRWLISRERCSRSGQTRIRLEALYDYAGFLFHTLGGQAYLRRRSPATEALASFYALLILDRARQENINPQGIDPRPEIRRTRELLATQPFVFEDRYRELLDEMEERWGRQ